MIGGTSGLLRGKSSERAILFKMEADEHDRRTTHSTARTDDYDYGTRDRKREIII